MIRRAIAPRPDWQAKVEQLGLIWHTVDGRPYWDESACYSFTLAQIEEIEATTAELYRLFLEAGQHVVDTPELLASFGIPAFCHDAIRAAWNNEPPALNFGRFDLGYDGKSPPKLFEFNCDTPTSLLEAAVVQWAWKEECFPALDQFTSLHDKLEAKWRDLNPHLHGSLHFAHVADAAGEDTITTSYLRDTAAAAGITTLPIVMEDLGWHHGERQFVDLDVRLILAVFKLYPWEWLVNSVAYTSHLGSRRCRTVPHVVLAEQPRLAPSVARRARRRRPRAPRISRSSPPAVARGSAMPVG